MNTEEDEIFSENSQVLKKAYYSIREVCDMMGLEAHVLRYWESEFPQLKPKKNRAGNRAYREKDIELIRYIKTLLYEEKFTISGAKKRLLEPKEPSVEQTKLDLPIPTPEISDPASTKTEIIQEIKKELEDILADLKNI